MTHQQLTPEIIHDLIVSPLPTIEICTRHQLAVADLRAMVESPEFRQLLEDLEAIEEIRAPARRRRALEAIERIAELEAQSPGHTETVRKAAAQILRTLKDPEEPQDSQTPDPQGQPTDPQSPQDQSPNQPATTPAHPAAPAAKTSASSSPSVAYHPPSKNGGSHSEPPSNPDEHRSATAPTPSRSPPPE